MCQHAWLWTDQFCSRTHENAQEQMMTDQHDTSVYEKIVVGVTVLDVQKMYLPQ